MRVDLELCSNGSVLGLYLDEIEGCGVVLYGQFHTSTGLSRLVDQALSTKVKQSDTSNVFSFDEYYSVCRVGVNEDVEA